MLARVFQYYVQPCYACLERPFRLALDIIPDAGEVAVRSLSDSSSIPMMSASACFRSASNWFSRWLNRVALALLATELLPLLACAWDVWDVGQTRHIQRARPPGVERHATAPATCMRVDHVKTTVMKETSVMVSDSALMCNDTTPEAYSGSTRKQKNS